MHARDLLRLSVLSSVTADEEDRSVLADAFEEHGYLHLAELLRDISTEGPNRPLTMKRSRSLVRELDRFHRDAFEGPIVPNHMRHFARKYVLDECRFRRQQWELRQAVLTGKLAVNARYGKFAVLPYGGPGCAIPFGASALDHWDLGANKLRALHRQGF